MKSPPDPAAEPTIQLTLAAEATLRAAGGQPVALAPLDAAMLAWLALEGPTPRARLVALLWPERDADAGRNNLRQRLFRLHRLAAAEVVAGTATLALAPQVVHDLSDADTVLPALHDAIGGEFSTWLEGQRARRRDRLTRALLDRADRAERDGDLADALVHAGQALHLQPLSEPAHRRVMQLHYLAGDRAAALLAFDRCERALKDEIGARPGAETLALLATIERATPLLPRAAPRALAPAVLRPPRLVGRQRELQALVAAARAGLHVVLAGEAGMGKSRLLAEAAQGLPVAVQVRARPGDADLPFAVFARFVRALLAQQHTPPAALQEELARFVPELGRPSALPFDAGRFDHAATALMATLPAAGAVIVDDLHFADAASTELLARLALAPPVPPLLLGLRPEPQSAAMTALQRLIEDPGRCVQVALQPLGMAALGELVESLDVAELQGARLAERLHRHTGGNPQFALETLRELLLDGRGADGAADALPLPAGAGAVVQRRLSRLSAAALKLARAAAILEGEFEAGLVAQVLGCDLLDLADAWHELESAHVLADGGFAHDIVHEAVKRGVPKALARPLHARVAQALEGRAAPPGAVARHWLAAGDLRRAVAPLESAARQALAATRPAEAAALFGTLADLHRQLGDDAGRCNALHERLHALWRGQDNAELDTAIDELTAVATSLSDRSRLRARQAQVMIGRWQMEAADAAAREALELALEAGEPGLECDARLVLSQVMLRQRMTTEAAAVMAAGEALFARVGTPEQRFDQAGCLGWLALEQERYGQALLQWQQLALQAREHGQLTRLATAMSYQMLCEGYLGRFSQAAGTGEQLLALMHEYRLYGEPYPDMATNLAFVYLQAGRYADALRALEPVLDDAARPPETGDAVAARASVLAARRAQVYCALGQPGRARRVAQEGLALAQHPLHRVRSGLVLARAQWAMEPAAGVTVAVAELLDRADAVAASNPKSGPKITHLLIRAELSSAAQRLAAARQALDLLAGTELHSDQVAAQARWVQALWETGRHAEARDEALTLLILSDAYQGENMTPAEIGLIAYRALADTHRPKADAVLRAALDWVHMTAAHQVPAEFRESFMHRHPVQRELLALAARLQGSR